MVADRNPSVQALHHFGLLSAYNVHRHTLMESLESSAVADTTSQDQDLTDILNLFGGAAVSNELDDPYFSGSLDFESGSSPQNHSNSGSEAAVPHAEAPATSLHELHMQGASPAVRTVAEGLVHTQYDLTIPDIPPRLSAPGTVRHSGASR